MATTEKGYTSFLGGEVSPLLWQRTDMERFGRWFKTAENIRFSTVGAFYNRPGFEKVAVTKRNFKNDPIKLLHFSFNDEESFLIELGSYRNAGDPGYMRVFKDGKPVLVEKDGEMVPYEIESPIAVSQDKDVKYAQAADIIFVTSEGTRPYEIRRLKADGTEWEIKEFEFTDGCAPLGEINEDKDKVLGFGKYTAAGTQYVLSFAGLSEKYFFIKSPTLTIKANEIETPITRTSTEVYYTLHDLATWINGLNLQDSIGGSLSAAEIDEVIYLYYNGSFYNVDFSLSCTFVEETEMKKIEKGLKDIEIPDDEIAVRMVTDETLFVGETKDLYLRTEDIINHIGESSTLRSEKAWEDRLNSFDGVRTVALNTWPYAGVKPYYPFYLFANATPRLILFNALPFQYSTPTGCKETGFTWYTLPLITATLRWTKIAEEEKAEDNIHECISHNFQFFKDKKNGDVFGVEKELSSSLYFNVYNDTSSEVVSEALNGGGLWRLVTVGNWAGTITLEYSVDNGTTWTSFYKTSCSNAKQPKNVNTSGEIEGANGLCLIRARVKQTAHDQYALDLTLEHKGTTATSYFSILQIESDASAIVKCIKNPLNLGRSYSWREAVFSNSKGWPAGVGFYQNRLFFSKDWQLFGSKTNDWWNFYEPGTLSDDDPITLSLLSYKVNNIRNFTTVRSFFVFTQGGEFGIASEGALTQDDKLLKQFSTHGSAPCLPIVVGAVILFVDKTNRSVRALQYSFESDNYEAQDVSVLVQEVLEKENFISAEYLAKEKEILFLSDTGTIWVLKFFPEQEILAWSHWKHKRGKITNICVVPSGAEQDLYVAVETDEGKQIERLSREMYLDSAERIKVTGRKSATLPYKGAEVVFLTADGKKVCTKVTDAAGAATPTEGKGITGTKYCWGSHDIATRYTDSASPKIGDNYYWLQDGEFKTNPTCVVADAGTTPMGEFAIKIKETGYTGWLPRNAESDVDWADYIVGLPYKAVGTLLSPEIMSNNGASTVYNKKKPFKVRFFYYDSYGFKIGADDAEKMSIDWQGVDEVLDSDGELTTGKKSVLIPSRYDGSACVSFVQEEPCQMKIHNVALETDYVWK